MTYFTKSTQDISLEECTSEFNKVKRNIKDLLYKLGDDGDNIRNDRNNLDEEFMRWQYKRLLDTLDEVYSRLEYLAKPVVDQGRISHNNDKRYKLPSGDYFTSGSVCEILNTNEKYGYQDWVYTRIEHNGHDYYATTLGKDVCIDGMIARVRG